MGIGKRELLEDYYYDELQTLIEEWNALHRADDVAETTDPLAFLGTGGEWVR